jgi:hypothetical protein
MCGQGLERTLDKSSNKEMSALRDKPSMIQRSVAESTPAQTCVQTVGGSSDEKAKGSTPRWMGSIHLEMLHRKS